MHREAPIPAENESHHRCLRIKHHPHSMHAKAGRALRADTEGCFAPLHVAGQMLLPLGREAAYIAFEGLEVRVLHGVCLEVLTLRRSCKTTNTAELRNTGESFALEP